MTDEEPYRIAFYPDGSYGGRLKDIEGFDLWLRKVKADFLKEIIREVRDIPCWYPDGDPMGGEFDLDGESHRRFVLDTLLAYGSKLF